MTRNREIERVLEEWFSDGPTQMPDHLFNAVVDRIDRIPQRRLARLKTRLLAMNSNLRLAAAAAIILAVAGVGAFALSQQPGIGSHPTSVPSPTAGQTVSPSLSPLPAALRYKWVGVPRTVSQIVPPITCSRMLMGKGYLQYNGCGPDSILTSLIRLSAPTAMQFTLVSNENGCLAGDVGTYAFTLSPNGKGLSLTLVSDPCASRAGAVSGDWYRSDCPDANSPCLGALDPGTYVSANFNPFVPNTAWVANYAALTYTVPAGWANTADNDHDYRLAKQGAPENEGIYLVSDIAAHLQDAACTNDVAPGIGQTASAITTWLTTLPGLVATAPTPTSIGGLSGFSVDVSIAPSWTHTCPPSVDPVVPLFTDPLKGGFDWAIGGSGRDREILLDLPDGRVILVEIDATNKAAFDTLISDAMPIVQTFRFKP